MNMNQEALEILIGKYLDGEITPSEQRILEAELDRDSRAKELLADLQDLHERSSELVTSQILGQGRTAADIFEKAWQQQARHPFYAVFKWSGYVRFAAGVAAGLAMGLALHFVLSVASAPQNKPASPNEFVQDVPNQTEIESPASHELPADFNDRPIRNVDWYNFTDKQGNQWLIEGFRENSARPAAYYGDL
jgi:anti-sigma factor RsiW